MRAEQMRQRGARMAESLMPDRCVIRGTARVWNEPTLTYITTPVVVYEGECELKADKNSIRKVNAAGQLLAVQGLTLKLPLAGSGAVAKDHEVVMLSCRFDPSAVGKKFTVEDGFFQTYATARRIPVKEGS